MSEFEYQHSGGCRCGAVSLCFHSDSELAKFEPRACQCEFCRPCDSVYLSAPHGELQVSAAKPYYLYSHRFGTNTADFVHCAACNTQLFVRSTIQEQQYVVIDAQALHQNEKLGPAIDVDYDNEDLSARLQRRVGNWIPRLIIEYPGRDSDV